MYAKALKKNQILDAGLECFHTRGYNGTGVKDIVDTAGVPKGSFYNYFESKEQFAVEALDRLSAEHIQELRQGLFAEGKPAGQRIVDFMVAKIDHCVEEEMFAGCLMGNLVQEMGETCEPIRKKVSELMDEHINVFAEAIREGQADGSINTELNALEVAEFLFASWEGALLKMKADRSRRAFDVLLRHAALILKP